MARVVRPTTGRAVLLTQDKTSMYKVIFQEKMVNSLIWIWILECAQVQQVLEDHEAVVLQHRRPGGVGVLDDQDGGCALKLFFLCESHRINYVPRIAFHCLSLLLVNKPRLH